MAHFNIGHRDTTVERMLVSGGFNRQAFLAVNHLIRNRIAAERQTSSAQGAAAATHPALPTGGTNI